MYGCVNWWNIVGFGIQTNEHLDSPLSDSTKVQPCNSTWYIFICFTTTRLYSTFRTRHSFTAWITQSSINPLIYSYCMIEFPNNWVCFIRGFALDEMYFRLYRFLSISNIHAMYRIPFQYHCIYEWNVI